MINTEAFTKRLQIIIDHYGESASSFAEKIGVQRSSISHILSGRNKPSLEFVLKTLSAFPEVELYWLLKGKGSFPKTQETSNVTATNETKDLFSTSEPKAPTPYKTVEPTPLTTETSNNGNKTIERIVIFYSDGSFKNFEN